MRLFQKKRVPHDNLFGCKETLEYIQNIYEKNCDLPIILYGKEGVGKKTAIIGLLDKIPCYMSSYNLECKVNNLNFFKVYNTEYPKVISYENVYYLNLEILKSNTEMQDYLKYLFKLAKSKSITSNEKKILVITHLEVLNYDLQKYLGYMMDKISANFTFIFTCNILNSIKINKIVNSCVKLHFKNPSKEEFLETLKKCLSPLLSKSEWHYVSNELYNLYEANDFHIGQTISQIKYFKAMNKNLSVDFVRNNNFSLMSIIVKNFIKKKMILSTVDHMMEVRRFIYQLLSLNIKAEVFVNELVKQLMKLKINSRAKGQIVEHVSKFSKEIAMSNKESICMEDMICNLIISIYSSMK